MTRAGLAGLGRGVLVLLGYLGEIAALAHQVVAHILRGELDRRELFSQMMRCGLRAAPLVMVTVGFSGLVFGVYAVAQFQLFGLADWIGGVVGQSMTRELAPTLAATVVAARSGSAIAAEVATMKVTEQLDALRAMATDPVEYLAVPRYVALVVMLPLVTMLGILTGTAGSAAMAVVRGVPIYTFLDSFQASTPFDYLINGLIKAGIFGGIIAIVSVRQGLRCGYGAEAVGRATTLAVVLCVLLIHTANLLVAIITS